MIDKLLKGKPSNPLEFIVQLDRSIRMADSALRELDAMLSSPLQLPAQTEETEIKNDKEAVEAMKSYLRSPDIELLKRIHHYIMTHSRCSFCRMMASTALSEAQYGNINKAKDITKELIAYYEQSVDELKKYYEDKLKETKGV